MLSRDDFATHLRVEHSRMVATMREKTLSQVEAYASGSPALQDQVAGEITEMWRLTRTRFGENTGFHNDDFEFFATIGAHRANTRFRMDDLSAGFEVTYLAGLQFILAHFDTRHHDDLMRFFAWSTAEIVKVKDAVLSAYLGTQRDIGDMRDGQRFLVQRLLEGNLDESLAASMRLPRSCLVLLCCPRRPLETGSLARERFFADLPGVLWREDPGSDGLLVLIPAGQPDRSAARVTANELVDRITAAAGRVNAAEAYAPSLADVPAAYREAREAAGWIAAMPDVQRRPYRTEDLLTERIIDRDAEFRARLLDVLAPLRQGTNLLRTLEVLFDCELNRDRAARELSIHRRTLTYRLTRIHALTGLDPTGAHGIQVFRSALTASRLARATPSHG